MATLSQLVVWPVSNKNLDLTTFQGKLKNSSLFHGITQYHKYLNPLQDMCADVLNVVVTPFQDPILM